jgi:hypothetical protein
MHNNNQQVERKLAFLFPYFSVLCGWLWQILQADGFGCEFCWLLITSRQLRANRFP